MTTMGGGAADKSGNRYEYLWTALRIADLLEGQATRLRLEPPGHAGVGIEFEIDVAGFTWGEQTKDSAGNWTIRRLNAEGVLAAAKAQTDLGRRFRLVVSSTATALATLADRARATQSLAEYTESLTTKLIPDFEDLCRHWHVADEEGWETLKSVEVERHPIESLLRTVTMAYRHLYADDPDILVAELRRFCDEHLHVDITAPLVTAHLDAKGFRHRLLAGDDDARRRLHRTVERQGRRAARAAPDTGLISRPEPAALLAALQDPDAQQVAILDGAAGYGKSAVAAQVASELEADGWFVAVARMDLETSTPTSDYLGVQMGLAESPSIILAGVSDGSPALLVIDQLDAVSLFSGRMPDSFDAIDEILSEIRRSPNIKLLLVCRSVDLEGDPRLRSLVKGDDAAFRQTLDRLRFDDVKAHLVAHATHVPADESVELLRIPLHLAVYSRLADEARRLPYRTLQELYEQLTSEVRRRVVERAGHLDWDGITSALVTYMSDHETLSAPVALLDSASGEEVSALESESLLVRDGVGIAFFHETYFDYLFARAFIYGGGDLHAFLADSGQYLFRRAQTRQVLEHLAATDRQAFRDVVALLLASEQIRPHVKDVIVGVLREIEPSGEDWAAIETVAWGDTPVGWKLLALLSAPGWFDAADELGRWEDWLADGDRVETAADRLVFAARQRSDRVADLVRPYVDSTEQWRLRLSALVSWSLTPALVDLAVELIERGQIDHARGPIAINSDFWSIVYRVKDDDPHGATRLVGAFLRRGLTRAQAEGSTDPFKSEHLATHSQFAKVIKDVASKAPATFVDKVLPFVVEIALANRYDREGFFPATARWGYRQRGRSHGVDQGVFFAIDTALRQLAADDGDRARVAIEALRGVESEELRFLTCRTLAAAGDADDAIKWLLGDVRNFVLGWADSSYGASRELIEACSPACSNELFEQLQAAILSYAPPHETGRSRGHGQYVLLSAVAYGRMSEQARRRLGELQRRFPSQPPVPPAAAMAGFVGSPISEDASKHMSDENWLSALRKHNRERTDWHGDVPIGGASQLAQVVGRRAKEEPARFAQLALSFDAEVPPAAAAQVLRNVDDAVDLDLLTDLCEHAAGLYGEAVGRDVCDAAQAAGAANARIVALVDKYSRSNDPDREYARTDAGQGDYWFGGDLFHAGLNSTRGEAARAAASILFAGDVHVGDLVPVVTRLATDELMSVRTCAAEAVTALLRHDNETALDIAERLFDAPVDIFDAETTERLLILALFRSPDRFAAHLQRAIDGPPPMAKRAGRAWAVAHLRGALAAPVTEDITALAPTARAGAAEVLAENVGDSTQLLAMLFDDPDPEVREQAARGMRSITEVPSVDVEQLIEQFTRSAAFAAHLDDLIDALADLSSRLPGGTLKACELAVDIAGRDLGDLRTARAAVSRDLITVVLRLYRQGDGQVRAQCLDLIDRLTELNAYGVVEALAEER
jgi:hypothetical protein